MHLIRYVKHDAVTPCSTLYERDFGGALLEEFENTVDYDALRRRVRLLMLLDGSERAGIAPMSVRRLHTYAYLSNVLAPVWNSQVFDPQLLKMRGGPFYPALQRDLDRLVGLGLVTVTNLGHTADDSGRWWLEGTFSLNYALAEAVLKIIGEFSDERTIQMFLLEVAYALSALTESEFDNLPVEDPTYSDPDVSYENVVDFADWRNLNYSANAARHFSSVSDRASSGDLIHLYVRHLRRRISGD